MRHPLPTMSLLGFTFAVCFCFAQPAYADTITIDVRAFIDGRDLLIIHGNTLQWHHLDFAAVGRHLGDGNGNEPTIITTTLNGTTVMDHVNWIPDWPAPPPNEIRFEAFSSIFTLTPALPTSGSMTVTLTPIAARDSLTIFQFPSPSNNFTTILDFNDDPSPGATWYEALLTISTANQQLMVDTTRLKDGTAGQPYSAQLKASGGSPPYSWSVQPVGNPPVSPLDASNLTLTPDPNNSDVGLISSSGIGIFGGTNVFTVQVRDSAGATAKQNLSITTPCGFSKNGTQFMKLTSTTSGFAQYLGGTTAQLASTVPNCFGVPPAASKSNRQQCKTLPVGCALTSSAAMLATIPNGSVTSTATPEWLDRQLSTPLLAGTTAFAYDTGTFTDISHSCNPQNAIIDDYCDFDDVTWASLMLFDQNLIFEGAPPLPSTFSDVDHLLEQRVCELQQGAILKLNKAVGTGNHFVLATGRIIDPASGLPDWQIFDGGQNPDHTSDLTVSGPSCNPLGPPRASAQYSLRGHLPAPDGPGGFCFQRQGGTPHLIEYTLVGSEARFYSASATWSPSPASLSLSAGSPVELLVTDPLGQQLGNAGTGQDIVGIPRGSYFRDGLLQDDDDDIPISPDATATKNAYILNPISGSYVVTITGTGSGTYHLSYAAIATDRSIQTTSAFGVSSTGSINQFTASYSPVPGGTATVVRMASFDSTFADIQNSLQMGLIDNQGIANSLSKKVQAAQQATGPARTNILSAFKDELSAQSGKHITPDVAQMLSEDADWLISH